jgi:hypothetical protein
MKAEKKSIKSMVKMPEKRMGEKEAELDFSALEELEGPMDEVMTEEDMEGEEEEMPSMLADIADDELIAEMKKRGLSLSEDMEAEEEMPMDEEELSEEEMA